MSSLLDTLFQVGWKHSAASIYLAPTERGELTVPQLVEATRLSRAMIYEELPALLSGEFVEYRKAGRAALYRAAHPSKLFTLLEEKKRQTALLEEEVKQTITTLVGAYNLANAKPGVRFFEGLEGIREILFDSLNATGEIFTFVEGGVVEKYIDDINKEYIAARIQRGIPKKIIMSDTVASRSHTVALQPTRQNLTEIKRIDPIKYPFKTAVQIYNDTVSYLSLTDDHLMGFLIKSVMVSEFHKSLFRYFWETLPSEDELSSNP